MITGYQSCVRNLAPIDTHFEILFPMQGSILMIEYFILVVSKETQTRRNWQWRNSSSPSSIWEGWADLCRILFTFFLLFILISRQLSIVQTKTQLIDVCTCAFEVETHVCYNFVFSLWNSWLYNYFITVSTFFNNNRDWLCLIACLIPGEEVLPRAAIDRQSKSQEHRQIEVNVYNSGGPELKRAICCVSTLLQRYFLYRRSKRKI